MSIDGEHLLSYRDSVRPPLKPPLHVTCKRAPDRPLFAIMDITSLYACST